MNKKEKTLTDIILEDNKYIFIKNYLEHNKNEILNILDLNVSYRSIFEAIKKKTKLNIEYRHFCRLLSDFKKKYIYNLSEAEYKKQMQAISQPATTTLEKKEDIKQPEKVETKKDIPADEKLINYTNTEEPQKLSRKERLLAIKNSEDKIIDVQKDQEKFVWTPSIKK